MSTLILTRGDTRTFTVAFTLNTYTPVDITGALDIIFKTSLFTCSFLGGQIVKTSPTGGIATLTIPGSSTSGVPNVQQTTPYQVTMTDALGNVTTTEGGAGSAPCNVIIYPNVG